MGNSVVTLLGIMNQINVVLFICMSRFNRFNLCFSGIIYSLLCVVIPASTLGINGV